MLLKNVALPRFVTGAGVGQDGTKWTNVEMGVKESGKETKLWSDGAARTGSLAKPQKCHKHQLRLVELYFEGKYSEVDKFSVFRFFFYQNPNYHMLKDFFENI